MGITDQQLQTTELDKQPHPGIFNSCEQRISSQTVDRKYLSSIQTYEGSALNISQQYSDELELQI
eukprot:EST46363.1 Hypothetical protein SS50377_13606 [Spironucleus salmonicida]